MEPGQDAGAEDSGVRGAESTLETTGGERPLKPRTDLVEEIDGDEIVIIDLQTSAGYTLSGPGLEVWRQIQSCCYPHEAVDAVARRYSGERDEIEAGVNDLLEQLMEEGLVCPAERAEGASGKPPRLSETNDNPVQAFQTPLLTKFEGLTGDLEMMKSYALRFG